eukprot:6961629-Pyramimonas_sp.AAC.1
MAGTVTNSAVVLGTDLATGQRRGAKNAGWKRRQRLRQMHARHKILKRYRGRLPRQKGRIGKNYVAGVSPAATFGAAVGGLNDTELQGAQRVMLTYKPPYHRGVSFHA